MELDEFKQDVEDGMLTDDDGFGHPCYRTPEGWFESDQTVDVSSSVCLSVPFTHVAWYNK
jgi:hypothetical protein